MKIILASNSPRRKELLKELVGTFDIIPSVKDERSTASSVSDIVKELACRKAREAFLGSEGERLVIGCDTVVCLDKNALGKPRSEKEAYETLAALSGRMHEVYTGVCIISRYRITLFHVVSSVTFKELTDSEIASYIATGSPFDKAGAYGIQDSGFVKEINGSYKNIMGFPSEAIKEVLIEHGVLRR